MSVIARKNTTFKNTYVKKLKEESLANVIPESL